jgi:hypothetical protein
MTPERTARIRSDLDIAASIVSACWGNFLATEPTYVLRDLIVVELEKARAAEREACAKIADRCGSDSLGACIAQSIRDRK